MASPPPSLGGLLEAPGGLRYRERLPRPGRPRALVVLLHGVGGRETDLADLASGLDPEVLAVLVRGRLALGPEQYGWFRVAFADGEPRISAGEAEDSRRLLVRLLDHLQAAHGIEARRTLVAGFSQGGILSASVALSAPERVGGFALLSGRILPELEPRIARPEWLAHLQAFVGHGEEDRVLPVAWAEKAERQLAALGVVHEARRYPGGHALGPDMRRDALAWMGGLTARG